MIGILNIGAGNVQSVYNAIYENGYDPIYVDTPESLSTLTHFILPGVGNFSAIAQRLANRGFLPAIKDFVEQGKPTLGICLGMQLLATTSYEGGQSSGLNVIPAQVVPLPKDTSLRSPHVGWNNVHYQHSHPVFEQIKDQRDFYFVHSYHMVCSNPKNIVATTDYGEEIICAVAEKNVVGVQFHPEKSQKNGMQLLENFCEWDGVWQPSFTSS